MVNDNLSPYIKYWIERADEMGIEIPTPSIDEIIEELKKNPTQFELKIGDRVIMNPEHEDYYVYQNQHVVNDKQSVGTITEIYGNRAYIKWDLTKHTNSYLLESLLLIDELNKETQSPQEQKNIEMPLYYGQVVKLNENSEKYQRILNKIILQDNPEKIGYVVCYRDVYEITKWKKLSEEQRRTTEYLIIMKNSHTTTWIRKEDVEWEEGQFIEIEEYDFESGDVITIIDGEQGMKEFERLAFKQGYTITNYKSYTEERKKIIEQINKNK